MAKTRELRDRVAEAYRRKVLDFMRGPREYPTWGQIDQDIRDHWLSEVDTFIANLASLNLAIVEKDAPHG